MDCLDVSGYFSLASQALGSEVGLIRFFARRSNMNVPFRTQPIAGIGKNPSNLGEYSQYNFNFHSVNRSGLQTYDACAAQKYLPGLVALFGPPSGLDEQSYWQWNFLLDWTGVADNYVDRIGSSYIPFRTVSWFIEELD